MVWEGGKGIVERNKSYTFAIHKKITLKRRPYRQKVHFRENSPNEIGVFRTYPASSRNHCRGRVIDQAGFLLLGEQLNFPKQRPVLPESQRRDSDRKQRQNTFLISKIYLPRAQMSRCRRPRAPERRQGSYSRGEVLNFEKTKKVLSATASPGCRSSEPKKARSNDFEFGEILAVIVPLRERGRPVGSA